MKKVIALLLVFFCAFDVFSGGRRDAERGTSAKKIKEFKPSYRQKIPEGNPVVFDSVWAWVMKDRENEMDYDFPVTDVCYFAADVDCYGNLEGAPDRKKLADFPGRVHLTVICDSRSLTHFVLDPKTGLTSKLIADIMKAAEKFDGLNVDYEMIPGKDAVNFINFLSKLSEECRRKGKIFTVCVPARMKTISDDIFPYKKIASLCDGVMVMAYDEHWSTSKPGPIASASWCQKIAEYSISVVPPEKLVMGLPFYGRTWASEKVAQGWYFTGVNRLMNDYNPGKVEYIDDVPKVDIEMKVQTECWFEDVYSTVTKMRMYDSCGVKNIAFWRIGQEDPLVWKWIKTTEQM